MKVFLSYCFDDEDFVQRVAVELRRWPGLETYCYPDAHCEPDEFPKVIGQELAKCQGVVLFLGRRLGKTQGDEIQAVAKRPALIRIRVDLPGAVKPEAAFQFHRKDVIVSEPLDEVRVSRCAREIVQAVSRSENPCGVPKEYIFDYEKVIIDIYARGNGRVAAEDVIRGVPPNWPEVIRNDAHLPNPVPIEKIGARRRDTDHVIVDARRQSKAAGRTAADPDPHGMLTFPEAGPREKIRYPRGPDLNVGIVVSGGIAPGINAVISGIVERHSLYHESWDQRPRYELNIWGFRDGLRGLRRGWRTQLLRVGSHADADSGRKLNMFRENATRGGTLLATSRCYELAENGELQMTVLDEMLDQLRAAHIEILYIIGGEGSIRAAHSFWTRARERDYAKLSIVAVPKTMDNDILWVWQSFGFLSAVEKAKELVLHLHTEARSNPRLSIVQLFGSDSGFVVSNAAHACGVCDLALIPEANFSLEGIFAYMKKLLYNRLEGGPDAQSPYGLIIMAETAIPTDYTGYLDVDGFKLDDRERSAVDDFVKENHRRLHGTTPDELRTGSLKIIAGGLQKLINERMGKTNEYWEKFRVFTNEPRHIIRAIPPSVSDVTFGQRLGALAVDNAIAGYTDFMISQWLTEFVLVPLPLVVLGRKRLPTSGIFWKSLIANTGQPEDLSKPSST